MIGLANTLIWGPKGLMVGGGELAWDSRQNQKGTFTRVQTLNNELYLDHQKLQIWSYFQTYFTIIEELCANCHSCQRICDSLWRMLSSKFLIAGSYPPRFLITGSYPPMLLIAGRYPPEFLIKGTYHPMFMITGNYPP